MVFVLLPLFSKNEQQKNLPRNLCEKMSSQRPKDRSTSGAKIAIRGENPTTPTGVIILPTQTMHYYKGNPSKLPYICKMGNLMTPGQTVPKKHTAPTIFGNKSRHFKVSEVPKKNGLNQVPGNSLCIFVPFLRWFSDPF